MTESVLSARKVRKRFRLREGEVLALKGLDLDVRENEFICIVGPSGCGKSTFLRMAGLNLSVKARSCTGASR